VQNVNNKLICICNCLVVYVTKMKDGLDFGRNCLCQFFNVSHVFG
jgi:hypothetical protein